MIVRTKEHYLNIFERAGYDLLKCSEELVFEGDYLRNQMFAIAPK